MHRSKLGMMFLIHLTALGVLLAGHDRGLAEGQQGLPGPGTVLPAFSVPAPASDASRSYLKLGKDSVFRPGDIDARLIIIEVFSVYCRSCQAQAPFMNELHARIEADPLLKNRVKLIGIGAGNDRLDLDTYKDMYRFPIVPDEDYKFHDLVGAPATPFLVFARPYGGGRLLVVDSHLGRLEDSDKLLDMARKAYEADVSKLEVRPGGEKPLGQEDLVIPLSDDELMREVRQCLSAMGEEPVEIKKIALPDLGTVYSGTLEKSKRVVFARVVARRIPCMDCEDVFFIYSFDDKGEFLEFVSIEIHKLDNVPWDEKDIAKMRNRFRGKSLLKPLPFNAKVDAVTSATISSKLIFDSMSHTNPVYQKLIELGYIVKNKK